MTAASRATLYCTTSLMKRSRRLTEYNIIYIWLNQVRLYAFNPTQEWIAQLKRLTGFTFVRKRSDKRHDPVLVHTAGAQQLHQYMTYAILQESHESIFENQSSYRFNTHFVCLMHTPCKQYARRKGVEVDKNPRRPTIDHWAPVVTSMRNASQLIRFGLK